MNELDPTKKKRLHDLKGVHASFQATLQLIQSGYHFDDEDADLALDRLTNAIQELDAEIKRLDHDWRQA